MDGRADPVDLDRSDRAYLEVALARLARAGKIAVGLEQEVRFRVDREGRVRWYEYTPIRVPASELEERENESQ